MFAQGLVRELGARGITVNNVQPGPIDTDLNPASGDWAVSLRRRRRRSAVTAGSTRSPLSSHLLPARNLHSSPART